MAQQSQVEKRLGKCCLELLLGICKTFLDASILREKPTL